MAIFERIPAADLGTVFKHVGWFAFCPVYLSDADAAAPCVVERNGVPAWLFDAAQIFQSVSAFVISLFDAEYEPAFMFTVTGELEPRA